MTDLSPKQFRVSVFGEHRWSEAEWGSTIGGDLKQSQYDHQTNQFVLVGQVERVQVVAQYIPTRLDLIAVLRPDGTQHDAAEAQRIVRDAGRKLAERALNRLAVGMILQSLECSQPDAVRTLLEFEPDLPVDPEVDTDVTFTINRPSLWRSLRVNRLRRLITVANLKLQGMGAVVTSEGLSYLAQVEVDVNTDAARTQAIDAPLETWEELWKSAESLAHVS